MNYYDMLGLKESAAPKSIDAAFKTLIKRLSSNIPENDKAQALEMTGKLNEAYSVLSGENSRKAYDNSNETPMSPQELGLYKNIQNKKYRVKINQSGYTSGMVRVPQGCVCCMSADAGKKYEVKKTRRLVLPGAVRYSTSRLQLPLCAECEKHIAKANRLYMLTVIIPAVCAAVLVLAVKSLSPYGVSWTRFAVPLGGAFVVFMALATLLRFRKQPLRHTSHNSPARYKMFTRKKLTFEFTNWEFAKSFAEANGSEVTEKACRKHASRRAVLTGYDPMDQVIIYAVVLSIFAMVLFGLG